MPSDTLHWRDNQAKMHHLLVCRNNVIVLQCRDTSDAMLVDAANKHEKLLKLCRHLNVRQIL